MKSLNQKEKIVQNLSYTDLRELLDEKSILMNLDFLIAVYNISGGNENIPRYAEMIRFTQDKKNIRIVPINEKAMSVLRTTGEMAMLLQKFHFSDQIPKNLVYANTVTGDMLWIYPNKPVKIVTEYKSKDELNQIFSGTIYYPPIMMLWKQETLYAYAYNEKNNQLYCLSIPHYEDKTGFVCLGYHKNSLSFNEMMTILNNAFDHNKFTSWAHIEDKYVKNPELYKKLMTETYLSPTPWNASKFKHLKKWKQTPKELLQSII